MSASPRQSSGSSEPTPVAVPVAADNEANRWRSHPFLSAAIRFIAVVSPAAIALVFSLLLSRLLPPPKAFGFKALWWVGISVMSIIVLIATQRVARRLLPLAALLKLSLLFPDQAPTRYKLARKVGRPKDLEEQLHRARDAGKVGAETLGPQAVLELVAALSVHDRATRGHSERVRIFTDLLAAELKLPLPDQDRLRWAALLHDVGKLRVSAKILRKPGKPTPTEWAALKEHPHHGSVLIAPIAPWLGPWADAVIEHHERYDGQGYPHNLRGEQISLGGRIVAVADSYETMTAARPYKRPLSPTAARNELVACSGAQFDPTVVRAFLNISLGKLWRTIGLGAWVSQVPLLPQISSGMSTVTTQAAPIAARGAAGLAMVASVAAVAPSPTASNPTEGSAQTISVQHYQPAPTDPPQIRHNPIPATPPKVPGSVPTTPSKKPAPVPPGNTKPGPAPAPKPAPDPKGGPPPVATPPPVDNSGNGQDGKPPKPPKPPKDKGNKGNGNGNGNGNGGGG